MRPDADVIVVRPETSWPTMAVAHTGRAPNLSHGLEVEASILARLLGIRLLRLHAHIDVAPANFRAAADLHPSAVRSYPAEPWYPTVGLSDPRPQSVRGGTLGEAVALLQRASRTLSDTRREHVARR
jgi:hypothetical protein